MFKISDVDFRTIGVQTSDDVYAEVRRITGNVFCASAAKRWADSRRSKAYSLLDYWDEQLSATKLGVIIIEDIPYFRVVLI